LRRRGNSDNRFRNVEELHVNIDESNLASLTADIVSAYVTKNALSRSDLPNIITSVHAALQNLRRLPSEPEKLEPRVPIKKSITPDYLISLEDGRRYKTLRRHLTGRGLSPEAYREKWGLPRDYPMVAPNYAKQRSELAKALGLGQGRKTAVKNGRHTTKRKPAK
jgi:predicted transcriptional regulator